MSDGVDLGAFVDPARYDFYDCKQLETERKTIAKPIEELQGLMAKADTGVAGPVVAELAYRNDYIADRAPGQTCRRGLAAQQMPGNPAGRGTAAVDPRRLRMPRQRHGHRRSGSAVY